MPAKGERISVVGMFTKIKNNILQIWPKGKPYLYVIVMKSEIWEEKQIELFVRYRGEQVRTQGGDSMKFLTTVNIQRDSFSQFSLQV